MRRSIYSSPIVAIVYILVVLVVVPCCSLLATAQSISGVNETEEQLWIANVFDPKRVLRCHEMTTERVCNATQSCYWLSEQELLLTPAESYIYNRTNNESEELVLVSNTTISMDRTNPKAYDPNRAVTIKAQGGYCLGKKLYRDPIIKGGSVKHAWCYEFFPLVLISGIFFLAALLTGFSLVGIIYMYMYYDVFSRNLRTGERVFNQYYHKTWPIVTYCTILFLACLLLAITAWAYWYKETICAYVPATFIFLIVLAVFVIGYPIYRLVLYIREKCYPKEKVVLDIDDYIMPRTKQALPSRANQVRCF